MKSSLIVFALFYCAFCASGARAQPAASASIEIDIPYVPNGGHKQQLDLYTPDTTGFPTILFAHEGSLTSGDRKDEPYAQMCRTFVELGISCAAISYRLAPDHKWPAQPRDVAAAFSWLKQNIAGRGGDPERIFLFGHSSGCMLVAVVATDARYVDEHGLEPRDIAGVIPMGCRLNNRIEITETQPSSYETIGVPPDRVDEYMERETRFLSIEQQNDAVPASHVNENLPPTLILIAEKERFFPPILRDAAEFVGRALSAGAADVEIAILDDRRHMTAIRRMITKDDPTVMKVVAFVRAH